MYMLSPWIFPPWKWPSDPAAGATLVLAIVTVCAIVVPIVTASFDRRRDRKVRVREIGIFLRLVERSLTELLNSFTGQVPYMAYHHICRRIIDLDATTRIDASLAAEVYRVASSAWGIFDLTEKIRDDHDKEVLMFEREQVALRRSKAEDRSDSTIDSSFSLYDNNVKSIKDTIPIVLRDIDKIASEVERRV